MSDELITGYYCISLDTCEMTSVEKCFCAGTRFELSSRDVGRREASKLAMGKWRENYSQLLLY